VLNVPGMSNPTRNLAQRDNDLAEKLNEVVSVVNNQEQFVPLPVIRTNVPPSDELVVTNYRIPAGFEARVLNAVISATPASTKAELDIYYSPSYGGSTGTAVVTVTPGSEFTGDVNFYQTGEFILVLKNTGAVTLELAASVMLTMRPLGAEGTLLVGSVVEGPPGRPGQKGGPGPPGQPGTGGAGSPGMIWRGAWVSGQTYTAPTDVVSFDLYGTLTSSFIAIQTHVASALNQPPSASYWNTVALGANGSITSNVFTSGSLPTYAAGAIVGTYVPDVDYVSTGVTIDGYDGLETASGTNTLAYNELYIVSPTSGSSPKGLAFLNATYRSIFKGGIKFYLPQVAGGAKVNWQTNTVNCIVTNDGTVAPYTMSGTSVRTLIDTIQLFSVHVDANQPLFTTISFNGQQAIP